MKKLLLVNFATPKKYNYFSIFTYLWTLLTRKEIRPLPKIIWYPLIFCVLLIRTFKTKKRYSPLFDKDFLTRRIFQSFKTNLEDSFKQHDFCVTTLEVPHCYEVKKLKEISFDVVIPLFLHPNYSTTGMLDSLLEEHALTCRTIINWAQKPWFDLYHNCMKEKILAFVSKNTKIKHLVITFHSLPEKKAINEGLYLGAIENSFLFFKNEFLNFNVLKAFQSEMPFGKWLGPDILAVCNNLLNTSNGDVLVVPGSFFFDCIETSVELNIELKKKSPHKERLFVMTCLNDDDDFIKQIAEALPGFNIEQLD